MPEVFDCCLLEATTIDLLFNDHAPEPQLLVETSVLLCLVDLVRFELTTSSMPWKRAPNCATGPYDDDFSIISK